MLKNGIDKGRIIILFKTIGAGEKKMPAKLDRCVKKLQKKGYSKNSAYAICSTSTGYKKTKRGKWKRTKKR